VQLAAIHETSESDWLAKDFAIHLADIFLSTCSGHTEARGINHGEAHFI
jgi:hypothetical protein